MTNKNSFFLVAILAGIILISILFWYSQPIREQAVVTNDVDSITKQLKNRSFYTTLPITVSASQIGKENPFK